MVLYIRSKQELEQELVLLKTQKGWSMRALARHFGISRNRVRRILRKHDELRDQGHDMLLAQQQCQQNRRSSKLDPFADKIKLLLEKYPKITGERLFEELKLIGYDGGISILRNRLRSVRATPKQTPVIRFETEPGIQGQMDWSPYRIKFLKTGPAQVQCFSYILGFSRRHFIDFTPRRDFFTLIRRHHDAFSHFGGVPAQCLYDSEKTVVLRWEAGRPVLNPAFSAFITHYHCKPVICQRRHPQTKGKVERPFQYVEGNLLCGREFQDLEDLRACTRWWIKEKSDMHRHETTGKPPLELFLEKELAALAPLPLQPYDCAEVALRVCNLDGYIDFETNRYPVPYEYVTDILTMKITEHEVFVYSPELNLIVRHERAPTGSRRTLDATDIHRHKEIRHGLESVQEQFIALGEQTEDFLRGLKDAYPKNAGFHARYILHLKERYLCTDIHHALIHAYRYHAYDCKAVERILATMAQPRSLEVIRNDRAAEELRKVLPEIEQRSLEEYAVLFNPDSGGDKT